VGFIRPFLREKKAWNNRKKGGVVLVMQKPRRSFMHTRKYYKSNLKSCYAFTLLKLITILINHCIKLRTGFRFLFMESIPFLISITNPRPWFQLQMAVKLFHCFWLLLYINVKLYPQSHALPPKHSILGKLLHTNNKCLK